MRSNVYLAFIVAAMGVALVNQAMIRYSWMQTTDGCSSELVEWIEMFHRVRVVAMGSLVVQVIYAWWIHRGDETSLAQRLGHVFLSLFNVVLMSAQMGNKALLAQSWPPCTESFEDAYGYTDYCQAVALLMYGAATMVGHAMPKTVRAKEEPVPMAPSPEPRRDSPLKFRGIQLTGTGRTGTGRTGTGRV